MQLVGTKDHKTEIAKATVRVAMECLTAHERSGGGLVELKQVRVACNHRLVRVTPAPAATSRCEFSSQWHRPPLPPQPPPQVGKDAPELVAARDIVAGELVIAPMSLTLAVDKRKSAGTCMTAGNVKGQSVPTLVGLDYGFDARGDQYQVSIKPCASLSGDNPTAFPFWFVTMYKHTNVSTSCEINIRNVAVGSESVPIPVATNVRDDDADDDDDDGGGGGGDGGDEDIAKGEVITVQSVVAAADVGGKVAEAEAAAEVGGKVADAEAAAEADGDVAKAGAGGGGRGGGDGHDGAEPAGSRGGARGGARGGGRGGGDGGRGGDRGRGRGRGDSTPAAKRSRRT